MDPNFCVRNGNRWTLIVKNTNCIWTNQMLQYELPLRGFREDASILPDGTPSGTRTLDTLIKSQVLYQLS